MTGGVGPVGGPRDIPAAERPPAGGAGFAGVMRQAMDGGAPPADLRLSAHAAQRLRQAAVRTEGPGWEAVRRAVGQAAAKGARQTLVLWEPCALVVAVPQGVVVTALTAERMGTGSPVVTGIDSAVFVRGA